MMTEQRETVGLARTDLGLRQTQVDTPTLIDTGIDQHLARVSTRRYQKKGLKRFSSSAAIASSKQRARQWPSSWTHGL
jgi:hypothetical protein